MAKTKKKIIKLKKLNPPKRDGELYVTKRLLELHRSELKSDNVALRMEMQAGFAKIDARFGQVDARFEEMDARFEQVDARFEQIDARFEQIDARFERVDGQFAKIDSRFSTVDSEFKSIRSELAEVKAGIYKVIALVEEQNHRNKVVLDSYGLVYDKLHDHDDRLQKIEKHTFGIEQK